MSGSLWPRCAPAGSVSDLLERGLTGSQERTPQTLIAGGRDGEIVREHPDANRPSGLNATALTVPRWPLS